MLGRYLNGLQRLAAHAVKDQLNGFHVTILGLLNDCPDDVLAVGEAVFCRSLQKPCELLPHPVVERPDFGRYTTPVYTGIALREGPAWPTHSLGCWLFCANRLWFHVVKYTPFVGPNGTPSVARQNSPLSRAGRQDHP